MTKHYLMQVYQGTSNSGKMIGVGSDGNITTFGGRILQGIYEPTASLGNDGDLYILCEESE